MQQKVPQKLLRTVLPKVLPKRYRNAPKIATKSAAKQCRQKVPPKSAAKKCCQKVKIGYLHALIRQLVVIHPLSSFSPTTVFLQRKKTR
jgi:hypothetical protein